MSSLLSLPGLAALTAGIASHIFYFHRHECHMYAFTYLNTFLAAYVCNTLALVKISNWTTSSAAGTTSSLALSYLLGVYGSLLIYRLFLNPLNRFPGPFAARISSLWLSSKMGNSDGYYVLQGLHRKYGKIVRIGSHDLSIIDPDAAEVAFGPKSKITKAAWYDSDYPLTSMHTSRDKGLHDRRRRVWAPAFSEKALRDYETEIDKLNEKVVRQVGAHGGQPVNVTKWFNLFSFDAMGLLAFGREYGLLDSGEKTHALSMLDEGMQPLAYRLPSWLFRMLTQIPMLSAGYQKFVQFCIDELTWRVQHADEKKRETDIVASLLKAYEDVPHPEKDTMLQADARLIIVAGSDTTAATFTFMFYHLAQNPEQVRKLRKELEPLTKDPEWRESEIRGAQHLNGCINESLRMHPPVPSGLSRLTPSEGMKVGETWIPGNVTFVMPQYTMGRDEDIYAEPDQFIPERWYSQENKVKHPGAFMPFSAGPFGCIGKNLALMELRTLTARLVLTYDMKLAPHEDGSRILGKTKDHFTVDLGDLEIVFTPRKT